MPEALSDSHKQNEFLEQCVPIAPCLYLYEAHNICPHHLVTLTHFRLSCKHKGWKLGRRGFEWDLVFPGI